MRGRLLACFAALLLCAQGAIGGEHWPRFRGATGMGITDESGLPTTWGGKDDENVLWKVELPIAAKGVKADQNQSSPIVWGGRVFVVTALWPNEAAQKDFPEQHVTCYQASDGKQLWDVSIPAGPWKLSDLRGGYSAPTPCTDGERVYALFGSAVLAALDFKGAIVWRKELENATSFDVAIASSPILHKDMLILQADKNNKKSTLTAYDCRTGEIRWEQPRPQLAFDHSTPTPAQFDGKPQLLIAASNALQGVDPATGEVLWWCNTPGDVCSPVYEGNLVYMDSGRGGPGVLVEASGLGDLSKQHIKWTIPQIPEALGSPAIARGHLFRLHNPGVLKCVDLATGREAFAKRLDGVSGGASPLVTPEGNLYFASAGKSYILKAGPTYELIATSDLGEHGSASPAVAGGKLFLKGHQHLFCIGSKK